MRLIEQKKIALSIGAMYLLLVQNTLFFAQPTNKNVIVSPQTNALNDGEGHQECKILRADSRGLVAEFVIPMFNTVENKRLEGNFQTLAIPGFSQSCQPAKPQLPVKGWLFASPVDAQPFIKILSIEFQAFQHYHIAPTPTPSFSNNLSIQKDPNQNEIFHDQLVFDDAIYTTDIFYPQQIATIVEHGFIRNQYAHQLQLFPVQYNPVSKEIKWYKKITIEIGFEQKFSDQSSVLNVGDNSPAFEPILAHVLLNYEPAKAWRTTDEKFTKFIKKQRQTFLAEGTWLKILLEQDGIYRLNKADLENAGLSLTGIDLMNIKMFVAGSEIPIYIDGQTDGVFDDTDYIEFYGTKIQSEYTRANVYWLTIGNTAGLRMERKKGNLSGEHPIIDLSKTTAHFEKQKYYETSIPDGEGKDHWFWNYIIAPSSADFNITLDNVANILATDCVLRYEYRGFSHTNVNPDHRSVLSLNGHPLADDKWDGQLMFLNEIDFPQAYLADGANTISVNLPGNTGSSIDIIYINWFEIDYWRKHLAQNDIFAFTGSGPGTYQFEIKGFTQPTVELFDVTDPEKVKQILYFDIKPEGGFYTLKFQDNLEGDHRYLALTLEKILKPKSLFRHENSRLRSSENIADYIIITHEKFYDNITPLANLRTSQGLKVLTIKIEDIYDEFNDGIKNPQAIQDFLSYAYHNWQQPAPTYVLLVGDATYDYKNVLGFGDNDYMPTHLFETFTYHTETCSDNWFACVSGEDHLPDLLIGRLPARETAEVDACLDKIINYESNPASGDWYKKVILVADNADDGGNFETISDNLTSIIPADVVALKVYLRDLGSAGATRGVIIDKINQGSLITNYVGHGSLDNWASETIFKKDDIGLLCNGYKLPLLVTLSCLNGFFHHAENAYSLAEMFLLGREKGAIAAFSPSGFGYTNADEILAQTLYTAFFNNNDVVLGSAIAEAKIALFASSNLYQDHIEFYNLLGDPSLRLNVKPNLAVLPAGFAGSLTFDGNPAPIGTTLSASINGSVYPTQFIIQTPGHYGIYLNGDDPSTPQVDGGKNGDPVMFSATVADGNSFALFPTAIFKSGMKQPIDLSDSPTCVEKPDNITIDLYVDDKKVGEEIFTGDPVSTNATIVARISTNGKSIDKTGVKLFLNERQMLEGDYFYQTEEDDPPNRVKVVYQPPSLANGHYNLVVEVTDRTNLNMPVKKDFDFTVNSTLTLEKVLNYPNPMQYETCFSYYLCNDKPAEVNIKIYTIAGRLIKVINPADGDVGYNETLWDGLDADGDLLANGLYLYKITARDGEERMELIERLVIAR